MASLEHYADLSRDFDLGIALISGERLRAQHQLVDHVAERTIRRPFEDAREDRGEGPAEADHHARRW